MPFLEPRKQFFDERARWYSREGGVVVGLRRRFSARTTSRFGTEAIDRSYHKTLRAPLTGDGNAGRPQTIVAESSHLGKESSVRRSRHRRCQAMRRVWLPRRLTLRRHTVGGRVRAGTTSLSNWMAEHPRLRFVPPAPGHDFREAHVFDFSPKLWGSTKPRELRRRLGAAAGPDDVVIDCKSTGEDTLGHP